MTRKRRRASGCSNGSIWGGVWLGSGGVPPVGKLQQRLRGLVWQMVGKIEDAVVVGAADVGQPLGRDTVVQQFFIGNVGKGERSGLLYLHVDRDLDLLDRLAHFDQLGRAGPGVGLQPPLLRPAVGGVVVIDVAEQEAVLGAVDDDADVRADACTDQKFLSRGAVELGGTANPGARDRSAYQRRSS